MEEIIQESVKYLSSKLQNPKELPKAVQKELAKAVTVSKHELKALELAGEGWKSFYKNHSRETMARLNTPKSTNLNSLFTKFLGVNELSSKWSEGVEDINKFVSVRGDIAHRGSGASYVTIANLRSFKTLVEKAILETDNFIGIYLKDSTPGSSMPWRRRLS